MPVLLPLEMPAKPELKDSDSAIETPLREMQESLLAAGLPAALDAAGVQVAFVTSGMKNPRRFPENLAAVVKAGLSPDKALAAVTTTPAALLGLSRSMGTLEPGKQANLLVVAGDLFVDKPHDPAPLRRGLPRGDRGRRRPSAIRTPSSTRGACGRSPAR